MNRIFFPISLILLLILHSCDRKSFQQRIEASALPTPVFERVDSIVINKMNQYNIPGLSIGLVSNDSIIYTKGYGVGSIEKKNIITENSIFHTASISKLFTALAIVKLSETMALSIDDRLIDLVPELNYDDQRVANITIKNLLNHTSGMPDINNYHWDNNNESDNSLENYILELNPSLESDPGTQYLYSNLAYDILGYIIEKVSGSTFDDYLKDHILNPNNMLYSDFRLFKIPDSSRTSPHSKSWITKKIYIRETYPYTREHAPSSTLNSSAKDLSKWMLAFQRSLDEQNTNTALNSMIQPSTELNPHIGLGFQLEAFGGYKKIGHYGGDKGFRSYIMMLPKPRIGLVLLANCDYEEDFRQEILHSIANLMLMNLSNK